MADLPEPISVDVCVCTFRRESVGATLASLAAQDLPDHVRLRVIVADNDEAPSAAARVREVADRLGLEVEYRHCPARNISIARNGALDAARADWVALIDDDETATPGWLPALLAQALASEAEVVLGPVRPLYGADAPEWMRASRPHAIEPTVKNGRISQGYTSNALLRRTAPAVAGQRFDLALGRSGGEDTEFFDRLLRRGACIAFAPQAVVEEAVPPERLGLRWLARRRFRGGQTYGLLLMRERPGLGARAAGALLSGGKAVACCGAGALNLGRPERRVFWGLRAALHVGVAARLCGMTDISLYGGEPAVPPAGEGDVDRRARTGDGA